MFKANQFNDQLDAAFVQYLNTHVRLEETVMHLPSYLKEYAKEFAGHSQAQLLSMVQLRLNYESYSKAIFEASDYATDFVPLFSAEQVKVIRQAVPYKLQQQVKKTKKKNALKNFVNKVSHMAKKALGLQTTLVVA